MVLPVIPITAPLLLSSNGFYDEATLIDIDMKYHFSFSKNVIGINDHMNDDHL